MKKSLIAALSKVKIPFLFFLTVAAINGPLDSEALTTHTLDSLQSASPDHAALNEKKSKMSPITIASVVTQRPSFIESLFSFKAAPSTIHLLLDTQRLSYLQKHDRMLIPTTQAEEVQFTVTDKVFHGQGTIFEGDVNTMTGEKGEGYIRLDYDDQSGEAVFVGSISLSNYEYRLSKTLQDPYVSMQRIRL